MIVIDTQALVWLFQNDPRLGADAVQLIEESRNDGGVLIPAIMTWEVAMLESKGRLVLGISAADWFMRVLSEPGFALAPLDAAIGLDAGSLGDGLHGDPADRIIIATARALGCALLTADEKILAYAARGHLRAVDARV